MRHAAGHGSIESRAGVLRATCLRCSSTGTSRWPRPGLLVPYLHDLGVSHIYASPLLKASPGSTHGYDICDFQELNPELGTPDDLEKLAGELRQRQMGIILDVVPNHMGIAAPENRWWRDLLAHGSASSYARCFDINWAVG